MTLADRLLDQGRRLFARRSTFPLILIPFVALSLPQSWRAEEWLGVTGNLLFQWGAISLGLTGLLLRCVAVVYAPDGSSSRDTHQMRSTTLNTTGAYSIVRHPLYLGSGMLWIGAVLSLRVWWLTLLVALAYWLYIERIMLAEEAYLEQTFTTEFRAWARATPAVVPNLSLWRRPAGTLQWRRLLSEHNGFLALATTVMLLEFVEDQQNDGETLRRWYGDHADLFWFFVTAAMVSIIAIAIRRWPQLPQSPPSPRPDWPPA